MEQILVRFIPLFLIILLGALLRALKVLNDEVNAGLKKLIINAALPSVLFLSFLTMEIKESELLIIAASFVVNGLLFLLGQLLVKAKIYKRRYAPFFFTGFEFGMVGVALFSSLFGAQHLPRILLIGLGHEFFIWFVYAPLLEARSSGSVSLGHILKSFFSSPIILAILLSLLLNLTGWYAEVRKDIYVQSVIDTLTLLKGLTTPLILFVLGYQLKFSHVKWGETLRFIWVRLVLVAALGFLFYFLSRATNLIGKDSITMYAFLTFFLLPPPYIIPVYLKNKKDSADSIFYNQALVVYTVFILVLFPLSLYLIEQFS